MKTVIFFAALLIGTTVTAQAPKGLESAKMDVSYAEISSCACLCSVIDDGDTTYFMKFDMEEVGILTKVHMQKLYNELDRILIANDRPVNSPDMISVTDYATHPVLSDIQKKLSMGFLPEERFDYVLGDYVVAFMYSWNQYWIMVYKNPFAGQY
jgi:hypothetical protein